MVTLYKNIKNKRQELNMSQDELAARTGYTSRSSIAKIEKGLVDLPQTKIQVFADALETTPAVLMGWIDEKDDEGLLDYFNNTIDEIISFIEKNGYEVIQTDSLHDDSIIIKDKNKQIIKTTTEGELVNQYEKIKIENLPKTLENLLNITSTNILPEHIRAAARGMTDLSPEDQKTAIDMINFLSKKGREAKNN